RGEQGLWILQTYQQESFSLQSINLMASFRDL
ncbi:MAG: Uma2 family endonuclease, partial [Microcystis aeruginosa]